MKDDVVSEVRRAREQQAAKFRFDLKAIVADARRRQKTSGHEVVNFSSKTKKP